MRTRDPGPDPRRARTVALSSSDVMTYRPPPPPPPPGLRARSRMVCSRSRVASREASEQDGGEAEHAGVPTANHQVLDSRGQKRPRRNSRDRPRGYQHRREDEGCEAQTAGSLAKTPEH